MEETKILIIRESDYYKLYSILEKEMSGARISIAVERISLEPMEVLILTQFIIRQKQRGCSIEITAKGDVLNYLNAIHISDFCIQNQDNPCTLEAISSYTAMPIRRVEEFSMMEYIEGTQAYFKSFCPGKDLGMLNLCLSELINNVYNHAHSPIGAYVFCQYYEVANEIRMAVSDLGIGIPHSVNSFRLGNKEEVLGNTECIKWALKENMTTKSIPQNMGKGLDTVKSFMKSSRCNWRLYSEDVVMIGYPYARRYYSNPIPYFKGTLVQLNIKIDNLPIEDIRNDFEWF